MVVAATGRVIDKQNPGDCHDLKPVEYWNAGAADVFSTAPVCLSV